MSFIHYNPNDQGRRHKAMPFSDSEWQGYKQIITQLHHSGSTAKQILAFLGDEHDFKPTSRQLWSKMNLWGLSRQNNSITPAVPGGFWVRSADRNTLPAASMATTSSHRTSTQTVSNFHTFWSQSLRKPSTSKVRYHQKHRAFKISNQRLAQLIEDLVTNCSTSRPPPGPSTMIEPIHAWFLRYGRMLEFLQQSLYIFAVPDIVTVLWMYLITSELAVTTALAAKHRTGREWFNIHDSQRHLQAVGRFLTMMTEMGTFDPEELSRFAHVYQDFDHYLVDSNLLNSAGEVSDEIWTSGLILIQDGIPSRMTTVSNSDMILITNAAISLCTASLTG